MCRDPPLLRSGIIGLDGCVEIAWCKRQVIHFGDEGSAEPIISFERFLKIGRLGDDGLAGQIVMQSKTISEPPTILRVRDEAVHCKGSCSRQRLTYRIAFHLLYPNM